VLAFISSTKKTAEDFLRKWTEYEQLAYWFIVVTDVGGGFFNWLGGLGFWNFWFMDVIHGTTWCLVECRLPYSKG
jgi:hypothetical protein